MENFDQSFALLKDWRERYANTSGFETAKSSSRSPLEDVPGIERLSPLSDADDREVGIMEMDMLKAALRNNLARLGAAPEGINETTLLEFAARMMQDRDAAEDIVGELADTLLGGDEDDEDDDSEEAHIPEWLARQLESKKADHDGTNSQETPQKEHRLPTPSSSKSASSTMSSKFAAVATPARGKGIPSLPTEESIPAPIDELEASHTLQQYELNEVGVRKDSLSGPQPNAISPRKRKVDRTNEKATNAPEPKRRAPSYAAPTATSKAKTSNAAPKTSQGRKAKRG